MAFTVPYEKTSSHVLLRHAMPEQLRGRYKLGCRAFDWQMAFNEDKCTILTVSHATSSVKLPIYISIVCYFCQYNTTILSSFKNLLAGNVRIEVLFRSRCHFTCCIEYSFAEQFRTVATFVTAHTFCAS